MSGGWRRPQAAEGKAHICQAVNHSLPVRKALRLYICQLTQGQVNVPRRFLEMAGISLSVAVISFVIGIVAKNVLGIDTL